MRETDRSYQIREHHKYITNYTADRFYFTSGFCYKMGNLQKARH